MRSIIDVVYDSRFPKNCLVDFYLPEGEGPWPVLIYFHGGGLVGGSHHVSNFNGFAEEHGIAVASVEYRMYASEKHPDFSGKYPDYIEDCAAACAFIRKYGEENKCFSEYWFGGSSAGGYLSMMLYFAPQFLAAHGLKIEDFAGAILDAGQPTTHFNILRYEHGIHHMAIRCDEAAPIWYIDHEISNPGEKPPAMIITASGDIPVRPEQNDMLYKTMAYFGYDMSKVKRVHMEGYGHCGYIKAFNDDGKNVFVEMVAEFMKNPVA